ncbi:MAG: ABC-type sugar transport system, periplasmic component [Devosia sp.]|nr:ABC-type sugar transport system, periplasmic component [Devosia sp.]
MKTVHLRGFNRARRIVVSAVIISALMAGTSGFATGQDQPYSGTQLTYWGGLIFSEDANQLLSDTIAQWGEANGVQTEVVMINQNETVQRVSAAVESGTMPDALDLSLDLLMIMSRQNVFAPLDELYNRVGEAQGGWYGSIDLATDTTEVAGGRTGLPFGASGNLLLRRTDLLEAAGFDSAPATWEELVAQAEAVNAPPVSGLGLALSNVGDGNVQASVLQSFGGRIANDAGENVTIKSEETRTYLTWLKDAWDRGVFPPGNATWDGAGDNQVYLSGQTAFIANTGSVGIAARNDDPELYEFTAYSALPAGPTGTISPITPQVRAVSATSDNQQAAMALLEHLSQPEFLQEYYKLAIYGPVLQGQAGFEAFNGEDPIHAGLLDLVQKGTAPGYPDVYNSAYADFMANFIVPKMAQRVVIDGWDFDRAMDEAQAAGQAIYDKY